jgi:hypothetical protein
MTLASSRIHHSGESVDGFGSAEGEVCARHQATSYRKTLNCTHCLSRKLYPLPLQIVQKVPKAQGYQFFVKDDNTVVLVSSSDRRRRHKQEAERLVPLRARDGAVLLFAGKRQSKTVELKSSASGIEGGTFTLRPDLDLWWSVLGARAPPRQLLFAACVIARVTAGNLVSPNFYKGEQSYRDPY